MELLNPMPPYNLFGIFGHEYDKAKFVVLPIPYDHTVTYKAGTRDGPQAIIVASRHTEFFNEETDSDIRDIGVYTLDELAPDLSSPENMVKRIEREVSLILDDKKIPVLIGGEHTISIGAIRALSKISKSFSVLQFDAHTDLRDEYLGAKYCHATVMARARELCKSCYSVGIRSMGEGDKKYNKEILYMKEMHKMKIDEIVKTIVKNTSEDIYLTIDFDVINPREMPSVGTPEPDGIDFYDLKEILKGVLEHKRVLGMDFVELMPIPEFSAPNSLAAKLIYFAISYAAKKK